MIKLIWHVMRHGHSVDVNKGMTVGIGDMFSKGWLYECSCGHTVAR